MTDQEHAYKPEAWRMTDYYPDSYAKFMSSLGIGIDYDDGDYSRYESQFRADLAAHDAQVAAQALREAAETFARTVGEPAHPSRSVVCLDMDAGLVTDVQTWLRDRADHLRENGGAE